MDGTHSPIYAPVLGANAMSETELTAAARDRIARNGFLVLRDVIDPALVADAREAAVDTVPEDLGDHEALVSAPEDRAYWGDLDDMSPFEPLNERLRELGSQLVGELESPGAFAQVVLRYPTGTAAADPDHPRTRVDGNPHVDTFQPDGYRSFALGATVYLDDVAPRAGGLTVWPGTHLRVPEYVADRADLDDCSNDDVPELLGDGDPFEVTGPAGTVTLWHPLLVHTGGMHLGRRARVASFTRFLRPDEEATAGAAAVDPFRFWDGVERSQ